MASKKDSDEIQAQLEAEKTQLQNKFLTLPRVCSDLTNPEDEPISPAVVIDESAGPLEPRRSKMAQKAAATNQASPVAEQPPVESTSPGPKPDLGATEFLLSGMMPSSESEEPPTQSSTPPSTTASSPEPIDPPPVSEPQPPVGQAHNSPTPEETESKDDKSDEKGGMFSRLFGKKDKKE